MEKAEIQLKGCLLFYPLIPNSATRVFSWLGMPLTFFSSQWRSGQKNPIGIFPLDHLKDHAQGLYNHLMNGSVSKDFVGEKLTNDMDAQFSGGYSIYSNDWLNHFMVDYDIIRILKGYVGYTSWSNVPLSERGYFYRGYIPKTVLPEWHIEEEKYNKWWWKIFKVWIFFLQAKRSTCNAAKYSDLEYFAFIQKDQQMMLQNIKDFVHIDDGFDSIFVPDCIDTYCGLSCDYYQSCDDYNCVGVRGFLFVNTICQ